MARNRDPNNDPPKNKPMHTDDDLAAPPTSPLTDSSVPLPASSQREIEAPETPEMTMPASLRDGWQQVMPWLRMLGRWLLVLVALYAVGWLLWSALAAMTPFIIGLVLAFLMLPTVNRLAISMPRWLAILVVYLFALIVILVAANYVIPLVANQVQQLVDSLPSLDELQTMGLAILQRYRDMVPTNLQQPIDEGVRNALQTAQANATTYLEGVGTFILNQVLQIINTVTFLIGFLIIPIWLFYVLNDQAKGGAFINRILHPRLRSDFWNLWNIMNGVLNNYIRGQLILGLAVGAMVGLGLFILRLLGFDVRYILLLAVVAGATELIPIIGPIIGAIPGVLIGFFSGGGSVQAGLAVLVVYIAVQQLENNLLVPRIIGESIGIHPAILTVVLIAMGQIFGLLGVVLAAPVAAIARDLFTYTYHRLEGFTPAAAWQSLGVAVEPPLSKRGK